MFWRERKKTKKDKVMKSSKPSIKCHKEVVFICRGEKREREKVRVKEREREKGQRGKFNPATLKPLSRVSHCVIIAKAKATGCN